MAKVRLTKIAIEYQALQAQIKEASDRINVLRSKCKHKKAVKTYGSNTGNYDPSNDGYWTEYSCPECGRYWTEEI